MGLLDRDYMNRDKAGSTIKPKKTSKETYYKADNFDIDFWNKQLKKRKKAKIIDKELLFIFACFFGAVFVLLLGLFLKRGIL